MLQEKDQMLSSKVPIKGVCHIRLFSPDGSLLEERIIHNLVTALGDIHVADAMSDIGEAVLGWIATGTGTGQGAGDVGLATSLNRKALTSTTLVGNDVVFVGDWAAGVGSGAITEAGIFVGDNNTSMNYYADFAVVTKGAADTLEITWTVTYGT